jgi:hypothetical protein
MEVRMSDIVYLYGFVPANAETPPRALGGVHGAPVSLVPLGGVNAVVSHVPHDDFTPDVIDANITDMNWVGARGLEHERVVAWFVDHGDILPVSLFTMFSSNEALVSDATDRSVQIAKQLARLHNHREWDLKVSFNQQQLAQHAASVIDSVRALDAEMESAAAGKRFLLQKKRHDILKRELPAAARAQARTLLEALSQHADDVVALAIPRSEELPVVMNAALLVARDAEHVLRTEYAERARSLDDIGITAQLTGPWAPYRFMESQDMEQRDAARDPAAGAE